jgi:tRNA(fMet)-specific endonuclease VapC
MNGFVLDTDTLTLAQFGHHKIVARMATHPESQIHVNVVSFQEQIQGWLGRFKNMNSPSKMADWYGRLVTRMFLVWRRFPLLGFSEPAILRFEQFRSLRLNVGLMDLRIAAIAVENSLTLVTRNQTDFSRVPGLTTEDWSL